jgi:hypothetical protein
VVDLCLKVPESARGLLITCPATALPIMCLREQDKTIVACWIAVSAWPPNSTYPPNHKRPDRSLKRDEFLWLVQRSYELSRPQRGDESLEVGDEPCSRCRRPLDLSGHRPGGECCADFRPGGPALLATCGR